jgi:hypothetical protein
MDEGGQTARSDLIGGAGWVVFGLAILAEALRMDRFANMGATLYTMPGFVPGLLGSTIAALGLLLALRGWRRTVDIARARQAAEPLLNRRVAIALPLMVIYAAALLGRVPFWLATALFVAAFTAAFAPPEQPLRQRIVRALLCGAATTAVVILTFQELFLVRLP